MLRKASEIALAAEEKSKPKRVRATRKEMRIREQVEEIPEGSTSAQARAIFRGNILRAVSQKELVRGLMNDLGSGNYRERSEARKFILTLVNKDGGIGSGEEDAPEMDAILGSIVERKKAGMGEPVEIIEDTEEER
jgi:hypothetical protein